MDESLSEGSFTCSGILCIHRAKLGPAGPSTHANVNSYVVKIAVYRLIQDTIANLDNCSHNLAPEAPRHECSFWIPAVVLMSALPKLVQWFHSQAKEKKAAVLLVYRTVGLFLKQSLLFRSWKVFQVLNAPVSPSNNAVGPSYSATTNWGSVASLVEYL